MADQLDTSGKIVTFSGSLSIDRVQEFKNELMNALTQADTVLLNISRAESVDVSFLQLLYAANKEAKKRKKTFHLTGTVPENLIRAFVLAGVTKGASTDARDLENSLLDFSSKN